MNKVITTRIQSTIIAAVIAAFPVGAIAQERTEPGQQPSTQSQPGQASQSGQQGTSPQSASGGQGGQQSTLPEKLQELVNNVAETNMSLIQLGFQAQAKATSQPVKQFASKSVEETVKSQKELAELANRNSFQLQAKSGESQEIQGTGAEFEKQYLQQVQQLQQKLAKQLEGQGNQIQNESLKKFITEELNDTLQNANETQKLAQKIQTASPEAIGEGPEKSQKQDN